VIRLLSEGAPIEATRPDAARELYQRAWDAASDAYEECMAAHYVARIQDSAEDRFRWNALALERGLDVAAGRATGFLPSLYLNMGRSFEDLGRVEEARVAYEAAAESVGSLPADAYRATLVEAIGRGMTRTARESDPRMKVARGRHG
jgi:tetratricopeptide (TPR) repeat protein